MDGPLFVNQLVKTDVVSVGVLWGKVTTFFFFFPKTGTRLQYFLKQNNAVLFSNSHSMTLPSETGLFCSNGRLRNAEQADSKEGLKEGLA